MNTVSITLDLSKKPEVRHCVAIGQADENAPNLEVSITDHDAPFSLSGWSASFEIREPGGNAKNFDGSVSGNVASFSLSGMNPGHTDIAYVVLEKGNMRVSTQRVSVDILEGNDR